MPGLACNFHAKNCEIRCPNFDGRLWGQMGPICKGVSAHLGDPFCRRYFSTPLFLFLGLLLAKERYILRFAGLDNHLLFLGEC